MGCDCYAEFNFYIFYIYSIRRSWRNSSFAISGLGKQSWRFSRRLSSFLRRRVAAAAERGFGAVWESEARDFILLLEKKFGSMPACHCTFMLRPAMLDANTPSLICIPEGLMRVADRVSVIRNPQKVIMLCAYMVGRLSSRFWCNEKQLSAQGFVSCLHHRLTFQLFTALSLAQQTIPRIKLKGHWGACSEGSSRWKQMRRGGGGAETPSHAKTQICRWVFCEVIQY